MKTAIYYFTGTMLAAAREAWPATAQPALAGP
jgi:hypothetical protein